MNKIIYIILFYKFIWFVIYGIWFSDVYANSYLKNITETFVISYFSINIPVILIYLVVYFISCKFLTRLWMVIVLFLLVILLDLYLQLVLVVFSMYMP